MAKKEWHERLSPAAKAEILAAQMHLLSCHMREVFGKLPEWYQKQYSQTEYDASVEMNELTPKDLKLIREYFDELNAKFPQEKPKTKVSKRTRK
jgi:hypothetical protein